MSKPKVDMPENLKDDSIFSKDLWDMLSCFEVIMNASLIPEHYS